MPEENKSTGANGCIGALVLIPFLGFIGWMIANAAGYSIFGTDKKQPVESNKSDPTPVSVANAETIEKCLSLFSDRKEHIDHLTGCCANCGNEMTECSSDSVCQLLRITGPENARASGVPGFIEPLKIYDRAMKCWFEHCPPLNSVVTAATAPREFKNVGENGKISSSGITWGFETEAELDRYTKATVAKDLVGINQALYEAHQLAPGLRALVIDRTIATTKVRMLEGSTAIIEQAYWVYQEDIE